MNEYRYFLNKAAFYIYHGGVLKGFIGGDWWGCKVVFEMPEYVFNKINNSGDKTVDYQKYLKIRGEIKLKIWKHYGIIRPKQR